MKTAELFIILFMFLGCSPKLYNVKIVDGVGYVPYGERKKGEMSKDILSTGDTLCAQMKDPYFMFIIKKNTCDTLFLIK